MNVTLVSSKHAKQVFEQSNFDQKNQQGQVIKQIKLEKPVEVLFEGVDLNKYFYQETPNKTDLVTELNQIKESFNYLFVGHWLQGEIGQDRKDVGMMIKTFLETFKGKKSKPGLILKTSTATSCIMDREEVIKRIDAIRNAVGDKDLPSVYVLHGDLDDSDINDLYNHTKVKAMVSFTKGEGYGRPLAEFCLSKKPTIAPAWSGQTDFLSPEFTVALPGQLTQLHPSAVVPNMLLAESGWFTVDYKAAGKALEDVYEDYSKYEVLGKRQAHKIKTEFSYDNMVTLLGSYFEQYVPKQVTLKLPTLKKIELPKLQKID
jgi:glycosyltransferase involved in cell wall biosynthesis